MASIETTCSTDAAPTADRRVHPRFTVQFGAAWSDGRRARQGEVLDASIRGLFLKPGWAPSESFLRGDHIELRCRLEGREVDLQGEVCWTGRSRDHDVDGIGLRIASVEALAQLMQAMPRA